MIIKVIALWYFLAGFLTFRTRFSDALVFGYFVSGRWAAIHNLIVIVFLAALGIGLWLRRDAIRRVAIGYEMYLLLTALLVLIIPASRAYTMALISKMDVEPPLTDHTHVPYRRALGVFCQPHYLGAGQPEIRFPLSRTWMTAAA